MGDQKEVIDNEFIKRNVAMIALVEEKDTHVVELRLYNKGVLKINFKDSNKANILYDRIKHLPNEALKENMSNSDKETAKSRSRNVSNRKSAQRKPKRNTRAHVTPKKTKRIQ